MIVHQNIPISRCATAVQGGGLLNTAINKLPFEVHLPGYQYCGPGTKLDKRLSRGDQGINSLDRACKEHDIAYSQSKDTHTRNQADIRLAERAWERVKASDSKWGEKINAWLITNTMKTKAKLGMGLKKKNKRVAHKRSVKKRETVKSKTKRKHPNVLRQLMTKAKSVVKSKKPETLQSAIKLALSETRKNLPRKNAATNFSSTRVIPVPKTGGVLPFLVPLFAGLSALGALGGGASGVAKAISNANTARKHLEESQRHNKQMETIAMGKGLYLKPYRKGLGLYMRTPKNH